MRTVTARLLGLMLIVLGAWGGIVAYVGPRFGFRMDSAPAWQWNTARWELHGAPGGVVVLGGLLLMFGAPRMIARFGALLALVSGIWFVVGPMFASIWLGSGAETQLASSTLAQAARPLGYHYGTGILIVAIAAYAWATCAALVQVVPYPGAHRRDSILEDTQLSTMLSSE